MKFDPTWRQVALLAVLLSAVVVTGLWVPGAVSTITSIVSTIVGALFVNLTPAKPDDAPAAPIAPVLSIVPKDGGEQ